MIQTARHTTKTGHEFLDGFVDDAKLVNRIKAQSMRPQWSGYTKAPTSPKRRIAKPMTRRCKLIDHSM